MEDKLAMGLLDGGAVKTDGEGAIAAAAVQRQRCPVAVFPSLAAPPLISVRV